MAQKIKAKTLQEMGFNALESVGGLLSPLIFDELNNIGVGKGTKKDEINAAYHIAGGLEIGSEIERSYNMALSCYESFKERMKLTANKEKTIQEFVKELLTNIFGFNNLSNFISHNESTTQEEQKNTPNFITKKSEMGADKVRAGIPIFVTCPIEDQENFKEKRVHNQTFHNLQSWVNQYPQRSQWGLWSDGKTVRLVRENKSMQGQTYIEADLEQILGTQAYFADFRLLWLLIYAPRFGMPNLPLPSVPLELDYNKSIEDGLNIGKNLRINAEDAVQLMAQGFIDATPELKKALETRSLSPKHYLQEILHILYRLIFLAVAEERELLHPKLSATYGHKCSRHKYRMGYGFIFWRGQVANYETRNNDYYDIYESFKIIFNALGSDEGEPLLAIPSLGGLFDPATTPYLKNAKISNKNFAQALYKLGYFDGDQKLEKINWQSMRTEELGSVYEGLLDLHPHYNQGRFRINIMTTSGERKSSGSYYTPDSLVQALLDINLTPALDEAVKPALSRTKEGYEKAEQNILNLKVIDPACGSGHFLLGAGRRMAAKLAMIRNPDAPDTQEAMRDIARHCLFGVDKNPMAIELAKVALWIETLTPDQPLGFLDGNLRCGDSILGIMDLDVLKEGIPDEAFKPLEGDDKKWAASLKRVNKASRDGQGELLKSYDQMTLDDNQIGKLYSLRLEKENTVGAVKAKKEKFLTWREKTALQRQICDLYMAAFFIIKKKGIPSLTNEALKYLIDQNQISEELKKEVEEIADQNNFFHWHLEFPDIFNGKDKSGFDVVIGNPPWEVLKLKEREFFANYASPIANMTKSNERKTAIKALRTSDNSDKQELFKAYEQALHNVGAASNYIHIKENGRFPLTGKGEANLYPLITETATQIADQENGQEGLLIPTGIATDSAKAIFFKSMVKSHQLVSFYDFENRAKLFPDIDSRLRFCLLSLGKNNENPIEFAFFLTDPIQMSEKGRIYHLISEDIIRINPNTGNIPLFRTKEDAKLTDKIYQTCPIFMKEGEKSPWKAKFGTMFHMSGDSDKFIRPDERVSNKTYFPLYEGGMIYFYDDRYATYIDDKDEHVVCEQKKDVHYEITPRYFVEESEVKTYLQNKGADKSTILIGWRNICRSTDERSCIPAIISKSAVGHSLNLIFSNIEIKLQACLYAVLASLPFDYMVRQKIGGTNFTFEIMKQLPILPPERFGEREQAYIIPRVLELTYTHEKMRPFARDLGYDGAPYIWDEERRTRLQAELDAYIGKLYALTRDEMRYILDPQEIEGQDFSSETFRILKERDIKTEIEKREKEGTYDETKPLYEDPQNGSYKTARLILKAWDRLNG